LAEEDLENAVEFPGFITFLLVISGDYFPRIKSGVAMILPLKCKQQYATGKMFNQQEVSLPDGF
jgi:hypothetical protein